MSDMSLVFLILLATTLAFVVPRFRPDLVAMCSLSALLLTGLVTPAQALTGFSNPVVLMLAGLFIVGEAVFQTGLAAAAGNRIGALAGKGELRLLLIVMGVVAGLSGFLSNTGTVAVLMPIVISLCVQLKLHPGRMLMPLAIASGIGGALTLIGTPPNLIAGQALTAAGFGKLGFFDFTPVGLVALLAGAAYMVLIGRKQLSRFTFADGGESRQGVTAEELAGFYALSGHFHTVRIDPDSLMSGRTLRELKLPPRYGITVLERVHGNESVRVTPETTLLHGDKLLVFGTKEAADRLAEGEGVGVKPTSPEDRLTGVKSATGVTFAEVVLTPGSALAYRTLEEIQFRNQFGVTVLAINRRGQFRLEQPTEERLEFGDSLLVHGPWEKLQQLAGENRDLVVLRHVKPKEGRTAHPLKAATSAVILLGMLLLMTLELVPAVIAVMFAALAAILTGCLKKPDDAYRSIHWGTIVLIAGVLPLATALEKTGGIAFIADRLVAVTGEWGTFAVLAGLYIVASLFSQFISNTATAVLLMPVAISSAQAVGASPYPFVIAVAIAASMAFATPVASPPNAMVMTSGGYSFFDYLRVGLPLQLVIGAAVLACLPIFYPF